eukprot:269632-Rhodomonas_salina.1
MDEEGSGLGEAGVIDRYAAIRLWANLASYSGPDSISADLIRRTRDISTPDHLSDASNRRPI